MPAISMFYDITIRMQSEKGGKHNTPHLHAVYNEHEIVMDFTGKILEGSFPTKQLKLLTAWTALHEDDYLPVTAILKSNHYVNNY